VLGVLVIELAKEVIPVHPMVRALFWVPSVSVLVIPIVLGVIWGRKRSAQRGPFVATVAAIVTLALVVVVAFLLQVGGRLLGDPVLFLIGLPVLVALGFGVVLIATSWVVGKLTTSKSTVATEQSTV
jgi:hypothetical protein